MLRGVIPGILLLVLVLDPFTAWPVAAQDSPTVLTVDHYVSRISTAPAITGQPVRLYVRERVLADGDSELPGAGRVVLFVHGSLFPSVPSFDLPLKDYSWMAYLAEAGFDVFAMDMTGSGWSTRPPQMEDPCNASTALQQQLLVPSPLSAPCQASYPFLSTNYPSQWDDVGAVVDFLRTLRNVERVSLIGWSLGGGRVGGYAALHPEKVDSLVLQAPSYNRNNPTDSPGELPEPGLPMSISSQLGLDGGVVSDREAACGNAYDPETNDVLAATNAQFDPLGATWGAGVVRGPTTGAWGWNAQLASKVHAPALLISGEFDATVAPEAVHDLYEDLTTPRKVFLELACSGHRAQHQTRYKIVQGASLDWLLSGSLDGLQSGVVRKGD
jgi:pimeloyl-ACP methyl ester carboxylesterase